VTVVADFFSVVAFCSQPMVATPTTQAMATWNRVFTIDSPEKQSGCREGKSPPHWVDPAAASIFPADSIFLTILPERLNYYVADEVGRLIRDKMSCRVEAKADSEVA
jgi:hypothetical protein